ncbi:MAG: tetratricopeptide repeat protein [Candidatus Eremiobacteraeota bacterium]|nr:tetratricopeptide repeat protein [Candidatus Eremiobacteraeota bacterium]
MKKILPALIIILLTACIFLSVIYYKSSKQVEDEKLESPAYSSKDIVDRAGNLIKLGKFKEAEDILEMEVDRIKNPGDKFMGYLLLSCARRYTAKFGDNQGEVGWDHPEEPGLEELYNAEKILDSGYIKPDDASMYRIMLGNEFDDRYFHEYAAKQYKKLLKIKDVEKRIIVFISLAYSLARIGKHKESRKYLHKTLDGLRKCNILNPEYKVGIFFKLSHTHDELGEAEKAEEYLRKVIKITPPDSYAGIQARIFLARSLRKRNKSQTANKIQREILTLIMKRLENDRKEVFEDLSLFGMALYNIRSTRYDSKPEELKYDRDNPFDLHLVRLNEAIRNHDRKKALKELKILTGMLE